MPNFNTSLADFSTEATNNIEHLAQWGHQLSMESSSIPLVDSVRSTFQDYVTSVVTFLNGLKVSNYKKQSIDAKELVEQLRFYDYSKTRGLIINVPAGFTGKWVPFLEFLIKDILPPVAASEVTLKMVNSRLAAALNEPDRLKAQSGIRDLAHKIALVDQKDYDKIKATFANHTKTETTVSAVVDRNADINKAFQLINHINAELGAIDFSNIQKLIERLGELTAALRTTLQSEEHTEMSGMITSQLSDLFYQLGTTLTAGAILMDIVGDLTTGMQTSRDVLLAATKSE